MWLFRRWLSLVQPEARNDAAMFSPGERWNQRKGFRILPGGAMGQILHDSAKTTYHAVRAPIQRSKATIAELAETYDLNPKTVMKWRRRQSVEDMPRPSERALKRAVGRGGSPLRCVPQAHPVAARRLPLCTAGNHSASDTVVIASLVPAARHLAVAGHRKRRHQEKEVQGLSDRLFPHRHRGSAQRRRQNSSVPRATSITG